LFSKLLIDALAFLSVGEAMPRGAGGKALGLYVLRSLLQAAAVLGTVMATLALGEVVASHVPAPWRLPARLLVGGLVLAPVYPFSRRLNRAAERLRAGQCMHCGYDLTGNVSGICPECGQAVIRLPHQDPPSQEPKPRSALERLVMAVALVVTGAFVAAFGYVFYMAWNLR
jgi:hypothetical protein